MVYPTRRYVPVNIGWMRVALAVVIADLLDRYVSLLDDSAARYKTIPRHFLHGASCACFARQAL